MNDLRYSMVKENILRVQAVFDTLKKFIPKSYHNLQLAFTPSESPTYNTYEGGYATHSTIVVGTKYINVYTDEISIAEMLAHEIGHHVFGHIHLKEDIVPLGENDADHFAMFLCELAGFSRKSYIEWFERFENDRKATISAQHIAEHGTASERINKLREQDYYLTQLECGRGL